jgi:hypothetical protein
MNRQEIWIRAWEATTKSGTIDEYKIANQYATECLNEFDRIFSSQGAGGPAQGPALEAQAQELPQGRADAATGPGTHQGAGGPAQGPALEAQAQELPQGRAVDSQSASKRMVDNAKKRRKQLKKKE